MRRHGPEVKQVKNTTEVCQNPWKRKPCTNTDIKLYIMFKGKQLPICRSCWLNIAEGKLKDKEWGERDKK